MSVILSRPSALESRLEFETLISNVSASLLRASPDEVDATVTAALNDVRLFFEADRCALLALDAERGWVLVSQASHAEGVLPLPAESQVEEFPWGHQKLVVEQVPLIVSRMVDLPPRAARDRASFELIGVRSNLAIPIIMGSEVSHAVVIHTLHEEREWPDAYVPRLRLLAEMLVNKLDRRRVYDTLRASEARLNLAAASAGAGLWELDLASGRIWATPEARRLYGYLPDQPLTREWGMSVVHPDDRPVIERELRRAWESMSGYAAEYRVMLPDGTERWLAVQGRLFPDERGKPARMLAASIDITDRKRSEAALKASEERFRQVAESTAGFIWEVDVDGRFTYVSPSVEMILGYTPDELVGRRSCHDLFLESAREDLNAATHAIHDRHRRLRHFANANVHKNGTVVLLDTRGAPMLDANGQLIGYRGADTDVTERQRAQDAARRSEEQLRESEARFRTVANSAPALIWMAGPDGLCTFFNTPWLDFTGRTLEQELGNGWADGVHREDRDRCFAVYMSALSARHTFTMEYRLRRHDGEYGWVLDTGVPRFGADGVFVGYTGSCIEITDRKKAEASLTESEARFRQVAESAGEFIWEFDATGLYTYASPSVEKMLGYHPDELVGKKYFYDLFEPSAREEQKAGVFQAMAERSTCRGVANANVGKDGRIVHLETSAGPVVDAAGNLLGYRGADMDVTERRRMESDGRRQLEEIKRLRDRLREENVYLRREAKQHGPELVVGRSPAIRRALALAEQVAATNSTVLLLGETGSGKERFASLIHDASQRRERTMIRVNCSAIPSTLIESELFGREKGAYTGALSRQIGRFELAHGSTLFLDEIGDLPADVQVKLLRAIEEHTIERLGNPRPVSVDVRIITATHRDLERAVRAGTFRKDLYYRLNVFPITVPPLRSRPDDIPLLVETFVEEFAASMAKRVDAVAPDSMAALTAYPWHGNVRELRNVVERAMILAIGPTLTVDLPPAAAAAPVTDLNSVERAHILQVLEISGWRVRGPQAAAERLGMRPTTLEARMKKLGIQRPRPTAAS